ncbi:hypothetical protein CQW23_31243 [Capsicum baccatum]|uniref:Uncharacterized protein n=1 Tax=Capsicum baccatum TaxID=33114 RepID=A0A2G2V865_CAPBA|nr:hypothetical protein CQW23_31243 [Capsicum baccatum]
MVPWRHGAVVPWCRCALVPRVRGAGYRFKYSLVLSALVFVGRLPRALQGRGEVLVQGSPTETLLRLLLPLNDKAQWTSRNVAGSEPPTSP